MRRTFKYKAKINKTTEKNALHWLDLCRNLYNAALEQRIYVYQQHKKSLYLYDQSKQLPDLKNNISEYKQVDAQCLQDVLGRLERSYQHFFRRVKTKIGKPGFPRFKGKNRYDSFTLHHNSWKLDNKYLHIRNVGTFKLFLSRPIQGKIKTVTIQRTKTNEWFVSFSCDDVPMKLYPKTDQSVGIDVGTKNFSTDSDGKTFENHRYLKQSLALLRRRQRALSRKVKGSNRRNKTRILVAKTHQKVVNQRNDFLYKTANYYINNYQNIYVEQMNIQKLLKNKYHSQSILDASWGRFFAILSYKAEEAGRKFAKVSCQDTSVKCSNCSESVIKKTLNARFHKCPACKVKLDRDFNASLNILRLGQSLQAST